MRIPSPLLAVLAAVLSGVLATSAKAAKPATLPQDIAADRTIAALGNMQNWLLVQPDADLLVLTASEAIRSTASDLAAFDACNAALLLSSKQNPNWSENYAPIRRALDCLSQGKATAEQLDAAGDKAVASAMARFDSPGSWLNAADFERLLKPSAGVGISLKKTTKGPLVISAPSNGPAYIAGLRRGDHLVAIDGKPVGTGPLPPIFDAIKGEKGTRVTMQVRRPDGTLTDFVVTRGDVIAQDAKLEIDREGPIMRVSVLEMSGGISKKVRDELSRQTEPVGLLVLDLRYNSGGLLDESIALANAFLGKAPIATVIERHGNYNVTYSSDRDQILAGVPMVVWVDEVTASGAEIVAAALQDNQRARVIGQTTFGLGRIQTLIPIDRNHALKVTTGQILRANGKALADTHVKPDCPSNPEQLTLTAMKVLLAPSSGSVCPEPPPTAPATP
ncbi:S41 family peptidase [Novosphingobium sp.]|uniref:S41 family peptidase n=1 Tax=Novosphingobium sp. TaxID=1874826 RepID=UPI00260FD32A|nr:S41 family peptidase [Novosphingobium sp.]